MPDHAKRKEIRHQVRPRHERERTRRHESEEVHHEPRTVTVAISPERSVDLREDLLERHVPRVHGHHRCLTSQAPQEPLFSEAPPGPSQDPVLYGPKESDPGFNAATLGLRARPAAAMLPVLDLTKRGREILPDPAEYTRGGGHVRELGVA